MKRFVSFMILPIALFAEQEIKKSSHPIVYEVDDLVPNPDPREWTFTFTQEVGYKSDSQKFTTLFDQTTSYLNQINTLFAQLDITFSWERLFIKLSGEGGGIISGSDRYKTKNVFVSTAEQCFNSLSIDSGYNLGTRASLGCRVKFWEPGNHSFSFVPALGYMYSHLNIPVNKRSQSEESTAITFHMHDPIQQDWFGVTAEGRISYTWNDQWHIDTYYQYIPIDFRQTFSYSIQNDDSTPVKLATTHIGAKSDTTRTQLGGIDISYRSSNHWQLGSRFEGSKTWSHTGHAIIHSRYASDKNSSSESKQDVTIAWTQYLISIYGAYWF